VERYKLALWSAWHVAMFTRQKRIPDLKPMLDRFDKPAAPKRQSPQSLKAMVEALNAAFGGKDTRKNG